MNLFCLRLKPIAIVLWIPKEFKFQWYASSYVSTNYRQYLWLGLILTVHTFKPTVARDIGFEMHRNCVRGYCKHRSKAWRGESYRTAFKTPLGWMTHICRDANCNHYCDCIHVDRLAHRSKEECEWYWTHPYSVKYPGK